MSVPSTCSRGSVASAPSFLQAFESVPCPPQTLPLSRQSPKLSGLALPSERDWMERFTTELEVGSETATWAAEGRSNFIHSLWNSFNVLAGVGLLSLPYALKESGWSGVGIILLLGGTCAYTALLLGKIMDCNPRLRSYPDIGFVAFGPKGHFVLACVFFCEIYLFLVSIIILLASNLFALFPQISLNQWMLYVTIATYPSCLLKDYSKLAWLSFLSLVGSLVLLLAILYFGFLGPLVHPLVTDKIFDPRGAAVTFSLVMGCYGGHSLYPSLYSDMEYPQMYPRVVHISFFCVTLFYLAVAALAFLMYGLDVHQIVIMDFEISPVKTMSLYLMIVIPYTKYGLNFNPIAESLEEVAVHLMRKHRAPSQSPTATKVCSLVVRTILCVSVWGVSMALPNFAAVMALSGALLSLTISVVVPCVAYLLLAEGELSTLERVALPGIAFLGVVMTIVGTIFTAWTLEHPT